MRQISLICFLTFSIFCALNGSGFDFNPHEVIRKSRNTPIKLELGSPRADPTQITFPLPTNITGMGADALLQRADDLSKQADSVLAVLGQLLQHFNGTQGPELADVLGMTADVKAMEGQFSELGRLINHTNEIIIGNERNVTYLANKLTCMKKSECNTGPIAYDCSLPTTTQTVSKVNDTVLWTFKKPTNFNCSLIINSQNGLWLDLNVVVNGVGSITVYGDTSGAEIISGLVNETYTDSNITDTQISIEISGSVSFTISVTAVDPCQVNGCGDDATCSVGLTNQPQCKCNSPCDSQGDDGKPCSEKRNPCDQSWSWCDASDKTSCVNFANATTCGYYCKCKNWPPGCTAQPQWCEDGENQPCPDSSFKANSFWKRDEEALEEFDPIEFVKQAKEEEQPLNFTFTMPDSIVERDPYDLLDDATRLTDLATDLMSQLQVYLRLFNNTQTSPENNKYLQLSNRYENAVATFAPLQSLFQNYTERYDAMETLLSEVSTTLHCYQNSNCHESPSTTTTPAPPGYDCKNFNNSVVYAAGDKGTYSRAFVTTFENCAFTISSNTGNGLWINLKISNFNNRNDSSNSQFLIETSRDNNYTVTQNQEFNNLTSNIITIHLNGALQYTLDYLAVDPCAGFNCSFGKCSTTIDTNVPKCDCDGCHQKDPSGRCTVEKIDPCAEGQNGDYMCTDVPGGKCHKTKDCNYYCICPNLPVGCQTAQYCDDEPGASTDCPPTFRESIFSKFSRFFN